MTEGQGKVPPTPGEPPSHRPPAPAQPPGVSSFPSADDVTMRVIPVQPNLGVTPPAGMAERRIGKYVVKRELGRGGMGAVYLAEQTGLGREVAIKELVPSAAADPVALKRFLQEAQVMARTSHPNLVQVYDLEQIEGANYIVLEFVRGRSLRDFINRGRIPLPQIFAVMHGILQALDYAHRHAIVHRDMKPENVLMSDEGDVKVADFGIARLTDDSGGPGSTATKTGTTVGTPQYMSPEQVASSKVDGRSDLYSTGIIFYELIVGEPPFTASEADGPFTLMAKHVQAPPKPPSVRVPGLDAALEEVVLKSISKRPEDRYQNGQEFDAAMSAVADRLCPGWQRSLEPGADLSKMVPRHVSAPLPPGTVGAAPPQYAPQPYAPQPGYVPPPQQYPPQQYAQPQYVAPAYNPTPPVKKPMQQSAKVGCMSVLILTFGPVLTIAAFLLVTAAR